jgi:pilus assembly protein CpaB
VTVQLGPQQTVGASIKAGDTVGVFISGSGATKLEIQHVLVTRVQGAPAPAPAASPGADSVSDPAPTASMFVTFAASGEDAEKILFAAQFATIWLSNEPADAVQATTGATQSSVIN